ncbi:MAG: type IV pilus assembly protein PilM [Patescibacteria group bacterium]|nr:pilus assembly protein PilM [Patescibacteria group bacterium]MBU1952796.1 pilus assembly protein PilM [Patescibacteria group bacterium]
MPIIGLNIGKRSFRAVELDFKKDKIILNNFGNYSNPKVSMDPNSQDDLDMVSQSLEQFFSEVGFSSSDIITSVNETNVFMRIIKLPAMNDKELKSSIKFEAEQYIPLPLDQVNVSYQKLEQDFSDKGKMSVQIVAARKDIVEKYVEILRKAKLTPKAIEPETIALGRVLGDTKENPSGTMILEMGYSNSLIVVCYGGFVRFTRAIPIGGDVITKTIMQSLSLDYEQAEEYKKVYGLDDFQGEGKVAAVIKPVIDNLILEVQRAAVFFTNHNPSASIKRVVLSGGTALMPNLLSYVANKLDLEVMLANPLNNIEISPKLEKQKQTIIDEAPLYSSVIGLALRKI